MFGSVFQSHTGLACIFAAPRLYGHAELCYYIGYEVRLFCR